MNVHVEIHLLLVICFAENLDFLILIHHLKDDPPNQKI